MELEVLHEEIMKVIQYVVETNVFPKIEQVINKSQQMDLVV
jgi:hypothetical protein